MTGHNYHISTVKLSTIQVCKCDFLNQGYFTYIKSSPAIDEAIELYTCMYLCLCHILIATGYVLFHIYHNTQFI